MALRVTGGCLMTTVHAVGMHLIRQRGTECSKPEFIEAYLAVEERRAREVSPWTSKTWQASATVTYLNVGLLDQLIESFTPPTTFAHRAGSERAS